MKNKLLIEAVQLIAPYESYHTDLTQAISRCQKADKQIETLTKLLDEAINCFGTLSVGGNKLMGDKIRITAEATKLLYELGKDK